MPKNHVKALLKKKAKREAEWYSIRSLLGNQWALFYFMIGGREVGKSYATTEFFVRQWKRYGRPFYWLRLTEASQRKLLTNKAEKLVDPDIRRKYGLDLTVIGDGVYEVLKRDKTGKKIVEKRLMARVLALSTFYNDKGSGLFDKDFLNDPNMFYNICLDEMNREQDEKNSFDIVYAFANQLENLVRSTKQRVRVICIGNYLEEASDILCAFNFLPEHFGRFKLKSKRAVIDYIEPSETYLNRRKGTVADILMGHASTFTNKGTIDDTLVNKKRLERPISIIKFGTNRETWFTLWNGNTIAPYNKEKLPPEKVIAMRPYINELFNAKIRDTVILQFDRRDFRYKSLICFKQFQKMLTLLKPRK